MEPPAPPEECAGADPAASAQQELPAEAEEAEQAVYTLPGLEGSWKLQQLVEMELQHDPRLAKVRRSALPPEFWDARRRACNHERLQRNYARRRQKGDAMRQDEFELLAGMDEDQQAAYQQQREAGREAAKAAAAAQRERVQAAMRQGLRVVVDCSLAASSAAASSAATDPGASSTTTNPGSSSGGGRSGSSGREVRSLCKQLELCAAANKRAARPVSLQFTGFHGPVKQFAIDGMHADRWPAARGVEAPLAQLYSGEELVVLSPDAQEPLLALDHTKVYVIGGLVDRTVQKGASLALAQQCGAQAARLPIAEHLGPLSRGKGVLNVDDVFHALLAVHAGEGWGAALERAIPRRFLQQASPAAAAAAAAVPAASPPPAASATPAAATPAAAMQQAAAAQAAAEQASQAPGAVPVARATGAAASAGGGAGGPEIAAATREMAAAGIGAPSGSAATASGRGGTGSARGGLAPTRGRVVGM